MLREHLDSGEVGVSAQFSLTRQQGPGFTNTGPMLCILEK